MTNDIYAHMREAVLTALRAAVGDAADKVAVRVEVTPARDPSHGDMATNAALVAAKAARQPPAKLAAAIVEHLRQTPGIAQASAAGPGFVNLSLDAAMFHSLLPDILRGGESYGDSSIGNGTRINVEYVSANPTGPMHIGHCRGAVVGDALANLLIKAGHAVTKEYYINDAGAQVIALAWAAYWRYLQAIGTPLEEADFSERVPGVPRRLPDTDRRAPGRTVRHLARAARRRHRGARGLARRRAGLHHRRDAAGGPRGPAPPRRRSRRLQLGTRDDRERRGGRVDRMVAVGRIDLRGRTRPAQGQDAR